MAKIWEDKDGNLGTIIVLKGNAQDYLPEGHVYHGEHDVEGMDLSIHKVDNGVLILHDEKDKEAKRKVILDEFAVKEAEFMQMVLASYLRRDRTTEIKNDFKEIEKTRDDALDALDKE